MKIYTKKFELKVPVSLEQAWDFFSSPLNLAKITPPHMAFQITSDFSPKQKMYAGMIITYKVSPLLGIKMNWATEITQVKEGEYFIDEQRFGPFSFWHHEHHFKAISDDEVLMTDILHYSVPLGFIGRIANSLIVANNVNDIFSFRETKIKEIFPLKINLI